MILCSLSVHWFINVLQTTNAGDLILDVVGFGDRLLGEVKQIAPKDIKIRVCLTTLIFSACLQYLISILFHFW